MVSNMPQIYIPRKSERENSQVYRKHIKLEWWGKSLGCKREDLSIGGGQDSCFEINLKT